MGCGGCGSGSGVRKTQVLRPQTVERKRKIVQRKITSSTSSQASRAVPVRRQAIVRDDRCPKCGQTIMLVHIAGRERRQCTACKHVIK